MKIASKIKRLKGQIVFLEDQIEILEDKILAIQEKCPHENYTKTYRSNEGNYDRTLDRYWVVFECLDCGFEFEGEIKKC
jgi:hypothetical protein